MASNPFSGAGIILDSFIPCFIETSSKVDEFMKMHVVNLAEKGLKQVSTGVAVMGHAYKKNLNDSWELPSLKVIEGLVNFGADVKENDQFIPLTQTKAGVFTLVEPLKEGVEGGDCVVFQVDYDLFRGISADTAKRFMTSPAVVDRICLVRKRRLCI